MKNSLELEKKIIGAMLREGADIGGATEIIKASDFTDPKLSEFADAIFKMHLNGEVVDVETVGVKVGKNRALLVECEATDYTSVMLLHYCQLLHEQSRRRILRDELGQALKSLETATESSAIIEGLQQRLFDLANIQRGEERWLNEASEADFSKSTGLQIGFPDLNFLKIENGDMVIVGGRPSMGKTALCLKIALNVARSNTPVLLYSLEMSFRQIVQRIASMNHKVPLVDIRHGKHQREEFAGALSAPILVDCSGSLTPVQLRTRARRAIQKHGVGLVVIDYLQLMDGQGDFGEYERITEISKGIKRTAKDLDVPIIVACQLNRLLEEKGADKRPNMSHLRGSGAIEQDADIIIFPYRPHVYDKRKHGESEAELIVAKNRNGGIGDKPIVWLNDYALFESLTPEGGQYDAI